MFKKNKNVKKEHPTKFVCLNCGIECVEWRIFSPSPPHGKTFGLCKECAKKVLGG